MMEHGHLSGSASHSSPCWSRDSPEERAAEELGRPKAAGQAVSIKEQQKSPHTSHLDCSCCSVACWRHFDKPIVTCGENRDVEAGEEVGQVFMQVVDCLCPF